jgi:hypothetical protein
MRCAGPVVENMKVARKFVHMRASLIPACSVKMTDAVCGLVT